MRNVRFQLKFRQWGMLAGGLMTAVGAAWLVGQPTSHRVSAVQVEQSTSSNAASDNSAPSKQVMVNGQVVPVDDQGNANMTVPGSATTVEVKDGVTTVHTDDNPATPAPKSGASGNMNLSMTSTSNGGSSFGNTNVFGSSFSSSNNGSSQSFSTTQVFSSDSANVHVTP